MAESPLRACSAELAVMVVDGTPILLPGRHARGSSERGRAHAARVAVQAVAAIGGAAMAVDLVVGDDDLAYVRSIDPAPRIERLNDQAISALVGSGLAPPPRGAAGRPRAPRRGRRRTPLGLCMGGAPVLGHRQGTETAQLQPQPGFRLTYHGNDIGVIERVETTGPSGALTLYVRGGISGALRYAIPADAVTSILPDERRVKVSESITFEPEAVGRDGEVLLVAQSASPDPRSTWRPHRAVPRTSRGFRVYADDGYLGEIETTLGATGRGRRLHRRTRPALAPHAPSGAACALRRRMRAARRHRRRGRQPPRAAPPSRTPQDAVISRRHGPHEAGQGSCDDQRGIVVLCASLTAAVALAVESVGAWLPWLLVGIATVAGACFTLAAAHARPLTGDRGDRHAGAD